jgi:alpha-L-arabinofuranosidase
MFYSNLGDVTLPYDLSLNPDVFVSTSRDTAAGEVIVKLVSGREGTTPVNITLAGASSVERNAKGWILTGGVNDVNTITEPTRVTPKEITINNVAKKFTYNLPTNSIVVLRLKAK